MKSETLTINATNYRLPGDLATRIAASINAVTPGAATVAPAANAPLKEFPFFDSSQIVTLRKPAARDYIPAIQAGIANGLYPPRPILESLIRGQSGAATISTNSEVIYAYEWWDTRGFGRTTLDDIFDWGTL